VNSKESNFLLYRFNCYGIVGKFEQIIRFISQKHNAHCGHVHIKNNYYTLKTNWHDNLHIDAAS